MAAAVTTDVLDAWVRNFADLVAQNREHLTELDSAIGDADHGSNMDRGMKAALAALDEAPPQTGGALLKKVGLTLVSKVGGASGPLFGTLFLRMGGSLGDADPVSDDQLAAALRAGVEGVVARGKPEPGDKTMFDALAPALDALDDALSRQSTLSEAMQAASDAAAAGRDATVPMQARRGRASYLGERSIGHQDPGATSVALLMQAATASGF
jgi:dihydroxyacetone kinase-like protein